VNAHIDRITVIMSTSAASASASGASKHASGGNDGNDNSSKLSKTQRKQIGQAKRQHQKQKQQQSAQDGEDDQHDAEHANHMTDAPKPRSATPSVHLKGVPMVLVTCDSGKESMAKRELMAWMEEYADRKYPRKQYVDHAEKQESDMSAASSAGASSVSSALEAELAALKAESATAPSTARKGSKSTARFRIQPGLQGFRGLFHVALLDDSIPCVEMVEGMLDEARQTKQFRTRYTVHLHPYDQTCYSNMESLFKMASQLLPPKFAQIQQQARSSSQTPSTPTHTKPIKYCIELVRRGQHEKMDRDAIIKHIASLVPRGQQEVGFKVDLKNPDMVILVEIVHRLSGIAVYTRYRELCKLNVRQIQEQCQQTTDTETSQDETIATPAATAATAAAAGVDRKRKGTENEGKEDDEQEEKAESTDVQSQKKQKTEATSDETTDLTRISQP